MSEMKSAKEWAIYFNVLGDIMDPDGWRHPGDTVEKFETLPIEEDEFRRRMSECTCRIDRNKEFWKPLFERVQKEVNAALDDEQKHIN